MNARIVSAELVRDLMPSPLGPIDPMPWIRVRYDDGRTRDLFPVYLDETPIDMNELIGLTEGEARSLWRRKDRELMRRLGYWS
jgi:hypothetical protein